MNGQARQMNTQMCRGPGTRGRAARRGECTYKRVANVYPNAREEENNYGTLARYKSPSPAHSSSSRTPQFNYPVLPSFAILPRTLLAMFARLPVAFLYAFVAFGALVAALPGGHPGTTYVPLAASSPSWNLLTRTRVAPRRLRRR